MTLSADHADLLSLLQSDDSLPQPAAMLHGLTVREVPAHAWDSVVAAFRDVVPEQTERFNAERWGAERLKRLAFFERGVLVGAVLARMLTIPLVRVPLIVVRWGPLWRPFGQGDDLERLARIHRATADLLARDRRGFLIVMPHSDPVHAKAVTASLKAAGFQARPTVVAPERYFVDVSGDAASVRASMAQKWRYNLKKAEKAGLTAAIENDACGLAAFHRLYGEMLSRKQFRDNTPVETVETLVRDGHSSLRPEICVVRKDGEPVAAAVIDVSGERAIYIYGASSETGVRFRAGYLMQWAVIEMLTQRTAIRWYDLGGSSSPTCSLHQFKRGLVGKDGVISDDPPHHVYAGSMMAGFFGHAMLKTRSFIDRARGLAHDGRAQLTAKFAKTSLSKTSLGKTSGG